MAQRHAQLEVLWCSKNNILLRANNLIPGTSKLMAKLTASRAQQWRGLAAQRLEAQRRLGEARQPAEPRADPVPAKRPRAPLAIRCGGSPDALAERWLGTGGWRREFGSCGHRGKRHESGVIAEPMPEFDWFHIHRSKGRGSSIDAQLGGARSRKLKRAHSRSTIRGPILCKLSPAASPILFAGCKCGGAGMTGAGAGSAGLF